MTLLQGLGGHFSALGGCWSGKPARRSETLMQTINMTNSIRNRIFPPEIVRLHICATNTFGPFDAMYTLLMPAGRACRFLASACRSTLRSEER